MAMQASLLNQLSIVARAGIAGLIVTCPSGSGERNTRRRGAIMTRQAERRLCSRPNGTDAVGVRQLDRAQGMIRHIMAIETICAGDGTGPMVGRHLEFAAGAYDLRPRPLHLIMAARAISAYSAGPHATRIGMAGSTFPACDMPRGRPRPFVATGTSRWRRRMAIGDREPGNTGRRMAFDTIDRLLVGGDRTVATMTTRAFRRRRGMVIGRTQPSHARVRHVAIETVEALFVRRDGARGFVTVRATRGCRAMAYGSAQPGHTRIRMAPHAINRWIVIHRRARRRMAVFARGRRRCMTDRRP